MKKGNIVRVVEGHWTNRTRVMCPTTTEEREAWYETDAAKGMNEAGETKLAPMVRTMEIKGDDIMVVERARCAPNLGWNKRPGMTKVKKSLEPISNKLHYKCKKKQILQPTKTKTNEVHHGYYYFSL